MCVDNIEKTLASFGMQGFSLWWRRVDSNHRSETQQIYSLAEKAQTACAATHLYQHTEFTHALPKDILYFFTYI